MNTDLHNHEARYQEADALVQRYIQSFLEKNIDKWMSLLDDNFVMEFPFAPQGRPDRIEGKANLYIYIQNILNDSEFLGSPRSQIYLTQDPDLIIVEVAGEGRIISTGRTFNMKYVWFMRTKDGKLIQQRDYWNPLATIEARKPLDSEPDNEAAGAERR